MKKLDPNFCDTVDVIKAAANWVRENCASVDESVMSILLKAAHMRRKEAAKKGDNDRSHAAFIKAIDYCVDQLRPLIKIKQIIQRHVSKSKEKEHATNNNRFAALNMDDSDDDDNKENEVASCETMSINELMAVEFLRKVNEQMEHHSSQFRQLKKMYSLWNYNSGLPEIEIIEQLMKAAAVVNLNIQTVGSEEQVHLNTIYRILAVVEQTEAIMDLSAVVPLFSPLTGTFQETESAAFVGDAIECAFRMPWPGPNDGQDDSKDGPKSKDDADDDGHKSQDDANDGSERRDDAIDGLECHRDDADDRLSGYKLLDHEFCCRWQLNKEIFRNVDAKFYFLLAQLRMQSRYPNTFQSHCAAAGFVDQDSWLTQYAFIGDTARPIMQTT
jgi:hypothetical protein